ncbi:hypothetical protein EXIGLDRAFT_279584 [Exidia glandulosa HHB12029]|uniref:Uncharacterized protein n=1 Tax=Exidia glandulosa HHB12029 TaxID=1314781 RepID=A0A165DJH6_EXIGL|nr:hypothetical protein EXIGLDRAFT_279584 [Exidia glandulosa HHB12029]
MPNAGGVFFVPARFPRRVSSSSRPYHTAQLSSTCTERVVREIDCGCTHVQVERVSRPSAPPIASCHDIRHLAYDQTMWTACVVQSSRRPSTITAARRVTSVNRCTPDRPVPLPGHIYPLHHRSRGRHSSQIESLWPGTSTVPHAAGRDARHTVTSYAIASSALRRASKLSSTPCRLGLRSTSTSSCHGTCRILSRAHSRGRPTSIPSEYGATGTRASGQLARESPLSTGAPAVSSSWSTNTA